MDRLSAVIAALSALAACEDKAPAGDPPSRVNAAKTKQQKGATVEAFCDVYATADKAKPMTWPAMTEAPPKAPAKWRWINIWASWCKPCIAEMPQLATWQSKLGIDLTFVSVDENADDITAFKKTHPDSPAGTLRLADAKAGAAWFQQLGIPGDPPPIPMHVFLDSQQRVRCVRAGGVTDGDLAIIEKLLAQ